MVVVVLAVSAVGIEVTGAAALIVVVAAVVV